MNMTGNRIAEALKNWKLKEERFRKMFPTLDLDTNPGFQRDKANFLESLYYRFGKTLNQEEKLGLEILMTDRIKLEQQQYVAPLERLFRWVTTPIRAAGYIKNEQVEQARQAAFQAEMISAAENNGFSREQLRDLGAAISKADVGQKNEQNPESTKRILVPVDHNYELGNVRHEILMDRDIKGRYHYAGFYATMLDANGTDISYRQFFPPGSGVSVEQSRNIMEGRPVLISAPTDLNRTYLQLDLESKKVNGEHSLNIKEVGTDVNPAEMLSLLPISRVIHPTNEDIISRLNEGKRTTVMLHIDGRLKKVLLVLNLKDKCLDMYGSDNKKFELPQEKEKVEQHQQPEQTQAKVVAMQARRPGNRIS